ncbi:zinc-ribbon domain-containing protein [Neobacillus sp. 179-J 1A1 HS]|uniref:zinc-ribbon domain-containing protein n=1 Tax=Neobacillus driksii TaxID=3035913 RepID=UPI0035BBD421
MPKLPTIEKSLLSIYPEIAKQWHEDLNRPITPDKVFPKSNKEFWWRCPSNSNHIWKASPNTRTRSGCPFCAGRITESLAVLFPKLSEEWHAYLNKPITSNDITPGSTKKVWWSCKVCSYEWESTINNRRNGNRCPKCAGKVVTKENCLVTIAREISKEWHPKKNGNLSPSEIHAYSNKKYWWICERGHEWRTTPNHRVTGTGCPICKKGFKISFPELCLYYYLSRIFPDAKLDNNFSFFKNSAVDIYIPSINLAVEYDGYYFHRKKKTIDEDKANQLTQNKINLVRIRESGLPRLHVSPKVKVFEYQHKDDTSLKSCLLNLTNYIGTNFELSQELLMNLETIKNIDIKKDKLKILNLLPPINRKNSLLENYPELAVEWDLNKNGALLPEHVPSSSHLYIWWRCKYDHSWQAPVYTRIKGHGCPVCAGQKATLETSIATINPALAGEWHPIKNGIHTPEYYLPNSNKKVWWICKNNHEWEAAINKRTIGNGCPYCSNKKINSTNNLAVRNPSLAQEWHPTKNKPLTPDQVTPGSDKKVWWLCKKGHEWEAHIYSRNSGRGCRECYKNRKR